MRTVLLTIAGVLAAAAPAAAQPGGDQAWFYCAALNPATSAISVSSVFQGSPARLDDYKAQTAAYFTSIGVLAEGQGDVACVWESDKARAEAGVAALTTLGPGDDPSVRFVRLDWAPKPGQTSFEADGAESLNARVRAADEAVQARNAKAQAEFEAQMARHRAAQKDYEARLAKQQAEVAAAAEARRKYEAERAAWEAQVKATKPR